MTTEASGGVTQIPKKNYIINPMLMKQLSLVLLDRKLSGYHHLQVRL